MRNAAPSRGRRCLKAFAVQGEPPLVGLVRAGDRDADHFGTAARPDGAFTLLGGDGCLYFVYDAEQIPLIYFDAA